MIFTSFFKCVDLKLLYLIYTVLLNKENYVQVTKVQI